MAIETGIWQVMGKLLGSEVGRPVFRPKKGSKVTELCEGMKKKSADQA